MNSPRVWLLAVFVACFGFFSPNFASAIDENSLEIDVQSFFFNYQENSGGMVNGQAFSGQENGLLNGLRLSYMRTNVNADRDFRINAFITKGNTDYNGTCPGLPATGVSDNLMMEIEVLTMYDYIKIIESQLYFGLGYRRWQIGVCSSSNNGGINEVYSWLYVPVGLRHEYEFSADLNCEMDLSVRMMLAGNFTADNLPINGQTYSVNMTLGSQFGVDLRVPFTYKLNKQFALVVTPWADYSQMGTSSGANVSGTSYQVVEPSNCTWQFGSDFGVRYTF